MSVPAHSPVGSHDDDDDDDPGDLQPPAHVHRTHVNATAVDSFRALSLKAKLKVCKDIEEQNDAGLEKTRLNASDPANHPAPGSETASLFSIDGDDLKKLKRPTFSTMLCPPTLLIGSLSTTFPTWVTSNMIQVTQRSRASRNAAA
jgi:hypothetical protein